MRSKAVHAVLSLLLLGFFCIPAIYPTVHALLESHSHDVCTAENEFHFHDDSEECQMCTYLINIKTFHKEDRESYSWVPADPTVKIPLQCRTSFEIILHADVRGPPLRA